MLVSLSNEKIKKIVKLRDPAFRKEAGVFIVDGPREFRRAVNEGLEPIEIFYCKEYCNNEIMDMISGYLGKNEITIFEVSGKVYEKISYGNRKDGIAAVFKAVYRKFCDIKLSGQPMIIIADGVEKPGNIGALLRTADCAGIDAVILIGANTDIYNPNIIRSSTGTVFSVPCFSAQRDEVIEFLKINRFTVFSACPDAEKLYTEQDFTVPSAFIFGSEDKGVSNFWDDYSIEKIKIRMQGIADSLNVSVSAAIIIFEAVRQRSLK
ncbi:MAG: RNA methyltransferase [Candidatus Omnitrophica bacterium]|nr:RNA methyltransferase [Candidatus Omnitrophota bacterium]MDD5080708.1 RNA methyltransferase [Candidatus Omnitrophota bacterium]MDD5441501.1 RNA methyltransferase [Candidatus Omnitrophota bacterium]